MKTPMNIELQRAVDEFNKSLDLRLFTEEIARISVSYTDHCLSYHFHRNKQEIIDVMNDHIMDLNY